jgi:hypothetical protein
MNFFNILPENSGIRGLISFFVPHMEMDNGSPGVATTKDLLRKVQLPGEFFFLFFARIRSNAKDQFFHGDSFPF